MTGAVTHSERPPSSQRRGNVITFVLLTFAATWTLWIAASAFMPLLFATPIDWLTALVLWAAAAILFMRLRTLRH